MPTVQEDQEVVNRKSFTRNYRGESKVRLRDGRIVIRMVPSKGYVHLPNPIIRCFGEERELIRLSPPEPHGGNGFDISWEEV